MTTVPESSQTIQKLQKTFFDMEESYKWYFTVIYKGDCPPCCSCRSKTTLIHRSRAPPYFRCSHCRKESSIFYHSLFYQSKIKINKLLLMLLYIWLQFTQTQINLLTGIGKHTIGFYQSCSRVVMMNMIERNQIKLGGTGKEVQIDEAIVRKRKYHRGRMKKQIWIFGMVESDSPGFSRLLLTVVPDRTMRTLIPIIHHHILPGTTIISDEWRAYSCLDLFSEYRHLTVNHSQQFRDPISGANTNKIEGVWAHIRRYFPRSGVREDSIEDYLGSFIVRHQGILDFENFVKRLSCYIPEENRQILPDDIVKTELELSVKGDDEITEELLAEVPEASTSGIAIQAQIESLDSTHSNQAEASIYEGVPIIGEEYTESEDSSDPYGAGTGESASEYTDEEQ